MWEIREVLLDNFKLDGGAMFGVVPKTLWSKYFEADDNNRIQMVTRCLLLSYSGRLVLIDCGCGTKWDNKTREIYQISNLDLSFDPESVSDVLVTHLHFDHCGGLTYFMDGKLCATFPNATVWVSKINFEYAQNPSPREKASYLVENFVPVKKQIKLIEQEGEILPGIICHFSNGHTPGLIWFEIQTSKGLVFYPSDLMPTSAHKKLVYTMGYDMCTMTLLQEKQQFLELVKTRKPLVIFEHDCKVSHLPASEFD